MIEEFLKILESKNVDYTKEGDNLVVGGYLYLRGTNIRKKKVQKPKENFWQNLKLNIRLKLGLDIKLSWKNGRYRKIDGLFCEVLEQKRNIMRVKINNKLAFIFQKDGIFAHGNTVKQAYFDWLFKTSDRDVEKYKNIKSDEVHTLDWWVVAYRTITGACSFGTNNYLENNKDKYKDKMTLAKVIEATKGQYGSDTFREFFKG